MTQQTAKNEKICEMIAQATNNFTEILSTVTMKEKYPELYWGGNGCGNRWGLQKFNYTSVTAKTTALYSENLEDKIPIDTLTEFLKYNSGKGIIGIFVHSRKETIQKRPIRRDIHQAITYLQCVVCGTNDTICDHKNDLYNDETVLNVQTQMITDFQPLCNHCNLQKRQVCKKEAQTKQIYSAKNIPQYKSYPFDFPWEKKAFDKNDINCKNDTYWFDPVEFNTKIHYYITYVLPIITEIKHKVKTNKLRLVS